MKTIHPFRLKDFPGFSRKDLTRLEAYYRAQLEGHAAPERRVGWNGPHSQQVRFEALALVGDLRGRTILDVGCGLGAFWGYLKKKRVQADYTGVDLFPNVIAEARRHYPGARFEARVLTARPYRARSFDYAFLSGVFNVKVKDNWAYMRSLLKCVLKQTRKAVAFNVLNAEAGLKEKDRFTVRSEDLVSFGRKLDVSKVGLLDHYHPMDLTLFLYR
ncbi:MAG TPA: class I SAM-dependent methyltransferase [bacterium]|nr:class I SAM-dependent methyltransferase [bacterium]